MSGSTEAKIATITANVRTLEGSVRDVEESQKALSDRFHDFELESVESRGKIEASLTQIADSQDRTEEMVSGLAVTVTEVRDTAYNANMKASQALRPDLTTRESGFNYRVMVLWAALGGAVTETVRFIQTLFPSSKGG